MKRIATIAAAAGLLVSGAALAGTAQPPVISGDSGNASNSSLGLAVYSFTVSQAVKSSIASAPGAVIRTVRGQQVITLDFVEGGVTYTLVVKDDVATVYRA